MKHRAPQLDMLADAPPQAKRLREFWSLNQRIRDRYIELTAPKENENDR